jgi:hypothetical protein
VITTTVPTAVGQGVNRGRGLLGTDFLRADNDPRVEPLPHAHIFGVAYVRRPGVTLEGQQARPYHGEYRGPRRATDQLRIWALRAGVRSNIARSAIVRFSVALRGPPMFSPLKT